MKLWSKEALVLGGAYGVLDTPFALLGLEIISDILFGLFIICVIMLCFNKTPKFISFMMNKYPKTSYYLTAIGWIPYFMIISFCLFVGCLYYIGFDEVIFRHFVFGLVFISLSAFVISLVIACIRARNKAIK